MLESTQLPPTETMLTNLLNDISTISERFILVMDDYHVLDSQIVNQVFNDLLEHLPPQMHLVIATREDPHLPLARLRAQFQLTELRAAELRFTPNEAAEFFNQVMGLSLTKEQIGALESRTEGWIAGLQLAALSMQNRQDTTGFIQSFTGSQRFVLDYLVEEVLRNQPEDFRGYLLKTSILDRLCDSLCNFITNQSNQNITLDTLERKNLFVIPLDDQRKWYRYHHLFAEVLRTFLNEMYPDQILNLHQRASFWFERNKLTALAINHALAAMDYKRAAALIEEVWLEMDLSYQSATWLVWVKKLPEEIIHVMPVLCVGCAWALLAVGEIEDSEEYLQKAEHMLFKREKSASQSTTEIVVVDKLEFEVLPASIAAARAYRALALGDILATKNYALQALELVGKKESVHRTQATALLGMAEYAEGNLHAAEQQFLKFRELMWQANSLANAISITYILANIMLVEGRLQEAGESYRQSLQLAAKLGTPEFLGASDVYRGLSEVLCEQGDLIGAVQNLVTARQMGERSALTGWPHRLCIAEARIKEAQGDLTGALALLEEAESKFVRNPLPDRPIGALKARIFLRLGRVTDAMAWAHEQNLSPHDELSYLREFDHLTLARLLVSQFKRNPSKASLDAALGLLERLLASAEEGKRNGSIIEIKILLSLAHHAQGDQKSALADLEYALSLAEPEGFMRVFLDEGDAIRILLEKLSSRQNHPLTKYVNKLIKGFNQPGLSEPKQASSNLHSDMVEALSEREQEVLKQLRSELSGPEIARQLCISLHTLHTHTNHIFKKLGVNNRRSAIRRAEELDL